MLEAARTSDEQVLYSWLHKLGVNTGHLRLLEPTDDQLKELLEWFLRVHDRRLIRFISSVIARNVEELLLDKRPCQEQEVPLTLPYPAHRVWQPLAAVGDVFCDCKFFCDQIVL